MISIKVSQGIGYVWDPQEWLKLRTEHRISGVLDGPLGNGLTGRARWNLPMRLSSVEVQYLVAQGIAKTVSAPSLYHTENPVIDTDILEKLLESRKRDRLVEYKTRRRHEFETHLDQMLEGKKKKGKLDQVFDKDAFVQKELDNIDKTTNTPYEMYQLDLRDPWIKDEEYLPHDFPPPKTYIEKLKYRVFEDFHLHKKYWLSPGMKFGGDFLAYSGDPRHFHAEFIIMCLDKDYPFNDYVVSQCRLAMTVKKTLLIAKIDEETDKLMYYIPNASYAKHVKNNNE